MSYPLPDKERFVPFTPAGTCLINLAAPTEKLAWKNLMRAAAHMPYAKQQDFERRGYTVSDSQKWALKPPGMT